MMMLIIIRLTLLIFHMVCFQALQFLHSKRIPYGHLHSGNVFVISDGVCQLSDIENGPLNMQPFLHNFIMDQRKIVVGHVELAVMNCIIDYQFSLSL